MYFGDLGIFSSSALGVTADSKVARDTGTNVNAASIFVALYRLCLYSEWYYTLCIRLAAEMALRPVGGFMSAL